MGVDIVLKFMIGFRRYGPSNIQEILGLEA
jgi:hypothetical protein